MLGGAAAGVLGSELGAGALAATHDAERRWTPHRVRPGVLGSADTAALTYVEQTTDVCVPQSLQERLAVEAHHRRRLSPF